MLFAKKRQVKTFLCIFSLDMCIFSPHKEAYIANKQTFLPKYLLRSRLCKETSLRYGGKPFHLVRRPSDTLRAVTPCTTDMAGVFWVYLYAIDIQKLPGLAPKINSGQWFLWGKEPFYLLEGTITA